MKIKELKNPEPIKDALRICRKKVGSTHDMDDEERQIIIDFIKRRYSFLTCDEFSTAFDMAIDNRFPYIKIENPLKSRFTQSFLASIMQGYLDYKYAQRESKKVVVPSWQETNLKKLIEYWHETEQTGRFNCIAGVAVFGYELFVNLGHIRDIPIEDRPEFEELQRDYLKEKRERGATLFHLGDESNLNQYKRFIKAEVYKSFCLDRIMKGKKIEQLIK